jgi:hypothetical protein
MISETSIDLKLVDPFIRPALWWGRTIAFNCPSDLGDVVVDLGQNLIELPNAENWDSP